MSNSLVRKSLELFNNDELSKDSTKSKMKSRKALASGKTKETLKDQKVKSKIDEYRRKRLGDQTEQNIALLLKLSKSSVIPKEMTNKVIKRHHEKLSKDLEFDKKDSKKPKRETSCFSEADFAWFEKEYHVK